jgi:hypothetical protein
LRPRRAVQICVAVSERRIKGSHGGDVEGQVQEFSLSAVPASEAADRASAYRPRLPSGCSQPGELSDVMADLCGTSLGSSKTAPSGNR